MLRLLGLYVLICLSAIGLGASSTVVQATIESLTSRGYVLRTLTSRITVEDTPETRFWIGKAEAKRGSFAAGATVFARIKTTTEPGILREIADPISWAWLESIRKEIRPGKVQEIAPSAVKVAFADGTSIGYRVTAKSQLIVGSKRVSLLDLKEGQPLFFKGRTLPALDLWLVWASDRPQTPPKQPKGTEEMADEAVAPSEAPVKRAPSSRVPTPPKAKPIKLTSEGWFIGQVISHVPRSRMFDVGPYLVHVSYSTSTLFSRGGFRVNSSQLKPGQTVRVQYRRDRYGKVTARTVAILGGPF